MATDDELSLTFAALADPTRRAILARLAQGEPPSTSWPLRQPEPARRLQAPQSAPACGLITQARRAQWRPCRLEPERLKEVAGWVETYRHIWEERFARLDDYLRELQNKDQSL